MKRISVLLITILILAFLILSIVHAGGPNYATNSHPNPAYYDGYIQIQSSYNDGGYYVAKGSFTYKNGLLGPKTYSTSWGTSMYDSTIRSRSARYYDSPDPFAPVTTFTPDFHKVPKHLAEQGNWPI